jgi:hypothetical protein
MNISDLSVSQLQRVVAVKRKIEQLEKELAGFLGGSASGNGPAKRVLSAAAKARIAAAQKARWAKAKKTSKPRRKMSAAARKKFSMLAKARWAKAKAAGRKKL